MEAESGEGHLGILWYEPFGAVPTQWVMAYMIALIPTAYPFGENR